ncbi:outer membrane lipoprotein-sorting protein [Candidatus Poribacteria bacterium]|nr:outer membrane lipoprotein-sorting protein [Candidatus Poribacteria bacterium]
MRITRGTSKRILFVFLFAVVIGCVSSSTNIQLSPATRAEVDGILNTLQARYDLTGSLKIIQMAVTIEEGDQREEVRESLWYKKSESGGELLLIQALGPINEPRAVVIANRDENQFVLALLNEERTYYGPLSDGALKEIFGVDLRVSDVLSAIFANPFLDGRTDNFTSVESSGAKLTITRPGIKEGHVESVTLFDREGEPRVTEWHIYDENGVLQQRAAFSDYREVSGILRPHKVEIERPLEQTRVAVKITKIELNVEIKDSKFDPAPFLSEDFETIPLSELAQ